MKTKRKINVGIGFVTGRKSFKSVVKTYIDNWNESDILDDEKFALHLFVAYDLKYSGTKFSDYRVSDEEILDTVDSAHYLGNVSMFHFYCENVVKHYDDFEKTKLTWIKIVNFLKNGVSV